MECDRAREAISATIDGEDGGIPDDIVRNAPETQGHFFLVPKVVE